MATIRVILLTSSVLIQSCAQGFIYTHTTMPLTTNMQNTPIGVEKQEGSTKQVSFQVQARWDTNGLGEIAKQHGLEKIYYADMETFKIFRFWQQNTVHVYGE